MRVRVTARFKDRKAGGYHDAGDVLTVTKERGEELVAAGVAEAVKSRKSRKRKKPGEDKARRPSEDK